MTHFPLAASSISFGLDSKATASTPQAPVQLRPEDESTTSTLTRDELVALLLSRQIDPWTNPLFMVWEEPIPDSSAGSVDPAAGAVPAVQTSGSTESTEAVIVHSGDPSMGTGPEPMAKRARTDATTKKG